MIDNFLFSNGQDLASLNSTGVVSTNIWDLEEDAVTDHQVVGWLNVLFGAGNAGATEGLYVELRTSDNVDITTAHEILGMFFLTDAELTAAAGRAYGIGVFKSNLKKYLGVWYRAHTTALAAGATLVYSYLALGPERFPVTQKQP